MLAFDSTALPAAAVREEKMPPCALAIATMARRVESWNCILKDLRLVLVLCWKVLLWEI